MLKSRVLTAAGLATVLSVAACGPTKTGIENRKAASDRIGLFQAQLSYDQAKQSFEVGRVEKAEREIQVAIHQYPDGAEYYVLYGRILLELHQLERSMEMLLVALEKDPESHEAQYFTGIVYQRWSDDEAAYEHYMAASDLDTSNPQYLLAAAESLIALGEFDGARNLILPRLSYFEHNAAMHHLLGQIDLLRGDVQSAADQFTQAYLLNPEDMVMLEETARVQYDAGRYEACHQSLSHLRLEEDDLDRRSDLMVLEARCLALLERHSEARALYQQLSQDDPSNIDIWVELGTVAWEMEDYHRVSQCSLRIMSLAPERFEGHMLRGINERHHGQMDKAISAFRDAATRAPDIALPHMLLGLTLEENGDLASAAAAYGDAVRIDPGNQEAAVLLDRLSQTETASVPETQ